MLAARRQHSSFSTLKLMMDQSYKPRVENPNNVVVCYEMTQISSALSDQSLHCPQEKSLGPKVITECTVNTLIRLGGC